MNYQQALDYINALNKFGSQLGLERIKRLLNLMNNPQDKLKFVHIAGTNGKGSIASLSTNILKNANYNVGTYISPMVKDFRERIQFNSHMIEKSEVVSLIKYIDPIIKQMESEGLQPTEFEVVTALSFKYFYDKKCDIVCLEVGLGGLEDATNIIKSPLCCIVSSISLDHTDILGDTIEKIAIQKSGIIKDRTNVVSYPLQDNDAVSVLLHQCYKTNSKFVMPNHNAVDIIECGPLGSKFIYNNETFKLRLAGKHQIYNAITVIEAMNILVKSGFNIDIDNIKKGLKFTTVVARFEIMSKKPLIIVDGAHNKEGVTALMNTLRKIEQEPKVAIIGMMADKDCKSAIELIAEQCKTIITIPVDNPRAINPNTLANYAQSHIKDVFVEEDYAAALNKGLEHIKESGTLLVCGSFYMARDMRKVIKEILKNL